MNAASALIAGLAAIASAASAAGGSGTAIDNGDRHAERHPLDEGPPARRLPQQWPQWPCNPSTTSPKWHPVYAAGWDRGHCTFTQDCNSPGYSSNLECCQGAYAGQMTGHCISQLESPPTLSPTETGGLDIYYPDYSTPWDEAYCINKRPKPSGWPSYSSMLECCQTAYAGQYTGKCISMLPSPPTTSPTTTDRDAGFWYAMYEQPWDRSGCSNQLPLPYNNINDRPNYRTHAACCASAYGGQLSRACVCGGPDPPLSCRAPTPAGATQSATQTPPPTRKPTRKPTAHPTEALTRAPSASPSSSPTASPTRAPSGSPSSSPTASPHGLRCIDEDFASGQLNGWYADSGAENVVTEGGETYLAVTERTGRWSGPKIVLDTACIEAGYKYQITARLRLTRPDGGVSECANGATNRCPQLSMQYEAAPFPSCESPTKTSGPCYGYASLIDPSLIWTDDVWATMTGNIDFYWEYPDMDSWSIGPRLYIQAPEIEANIHLDSFILERIPVLDHGVIPPGPATAESVTLPDPPAATADSLLMGNDRTDCPHAEAGLLDWHDTATWGGAVVPVSGDVTLPANSAVLVSQSFFGTLGTVIVPSTSSLIIGEHISGIEINAHGIDVQGSLIAGSETCRIETPITITLHGSRPNDRDINGVSVTATETFKGINVSGGTLSLHGKRYYRTWARLAETVRPGDVFIHTQAAVNWEPGQEIVLVTTSLRDDRAWHQNEVKSVVSVVPDPGGVGSIVTIDSAAAYTHIANLNYQGEVGLLSRTITIQGSDDSQPPSDIDDGTWTSSRSVYSSTLAPDPSKNRQGFGGHIRIADGGLGFVEGIRLYRMGQTNFLGRYPIHFHLLGTGCTGCYFRDSSIYKSFYRCVSIHGTNGLSVMENVGFDVLGYCYYLEDGIEEDNTISFNLGSHIHYLGEAPYGSGQQVTDHVVQSEDMILPADSTASAFYITNLSNNIIGNVASGGWAGFAMPTLREPLGASRTVTLRPSAQVTLIFDGNTAHSTGWWWEKAAGFYLGGSLFYDGNLLKYDAGRGLPNTPTNARERWPCLVDKCALGSCDDWCRDEEWAFNRFTNSKAFGIAGSGMNSWFGRAEVIRIETADVGLSMEALSAGFWIDQLFATCRTGEDLAMPKARATWIRGDGFVWYDTGQEHIMTNAKFVNCGYRSSPDNPYDQYDTSPTRGCSNDAYIGCKASSSVFSQLTHSDQFNPEVMQITSNIEFSDCGRRFRLSHPDPTSVSGRIQNWLDADGSLIDESEPLLVGTGLADAGSWWNVEDGVIHDTHGPLTFIRQNSGPARGLGHVRLSWDTALHATVGDTTCGNGGDPRKPCPAVGYIRHIGSYFDGDPGLPVTAQPDIAGPVGGFGWLLSLTAGAPVALDLSMIEVLPHTPLLISVQYPIGTAVSVTFSYPQLSRAAVWSRDATCQSAHYYDSSTGLLTVRLVGGDRVFSRGGLTLPMSRSNQDVVIRADCPSSDGIYCDEAITSSALNPCPVGYEQTAYDICCLTTDPSTCQDVSAIYAAPPGPSPSAGNLLSDPDFEGECGGNPWYADGDTTVLEIDQSSFASGSQSIKVMNRQSSWNGVRQDVTGIFLPGNSYRVTFSARFLFNAENLALKLNVLLASGSRSYPGNQASFGTTWEAKDWTLTVPADAVHVVLYVETPGNTDDFAVDGFVATLV